MKKYFKYALVHALATALYIGLVATLLSFGEQLFGDAEHKTVLMPMAMLLLFVCSAGITGSLVLVRPIMWYLDGHKKEAVKLFLLTLGILFVITVIVFTFLVIFFR